MDKPLVPSPPPVAQTDRNNDENALLLGPRADSFCDELSSRSPPSNRIAKTISTPVADGYDESKVKACNLDVNTTPTPSHNDTNAEGSIGDVLVPMGIAQDAPEFWGI